MKPENSMQILLDADAAPAAVKEILFKAAQRIRVPLILFANMPLKIPASGLISMVTVPEGPDEADHEIARTVEKGDLVITNDIPLADRVISKGAQAINFRGELYTADNIKQYLVMRDLMENLRNIDIRTGGPAPFSQKDRRNFANQLDGYLTKYLKKE